jgi:CubicO group peptidase (beta-lactamase class C family)
MLESRMTRLRAVASALLGALLTAGVAAQQSAAFPSLDPDLRERIDTYVTAGMEAEGIPGLVLAVVDEEHGRYLAGYGTRGGAAEMTPGTPVRIGSATKTVTALAVMQLVERGDVSLDTPAAEYLHGHPAPAGPAGAEVTVRHLLSHTSGIAGGATGVDTAERAAPPGERFIYADANFNAAGRIIEAVTGEGYEAYLRSAIFARLPGPGCRTSPGSGDGADAAAQGHARGLFGLNVARDAVVAPFEVPSVGLLCSAEAGAAYLSALLEGGGPLLSAHGLSRMWRPEVAAAGPGLGEDVSYGLGWFIAGEGRSRRVWHAGTISSSQSSFRLYPARGRGVFVAMNVNGLMLFGFTNDLAEGVSAILDGEEPAAFTPLETARTTRVIVTTATSLSLLWLLLSINAFRLRRRRGRLPVRRRRDVVRGVLLPLVPDALVLVFFLYSVPAGFGVGVAGLPGVALDLFMLAMVAAVPVALWALARTVLSVLTVPGVIGSR